MWIAIVIIAVLGVLAYAARTAKVSYDVGESHLQERALLNGYMERMRKAIKKSNKPNYANCIKRKSKDDVKRNRKRMSHKSRTKNKK